MTSCRSAQVTRPACSRWPKGSDHPHLPGRCLQAGGPEAAGHAGAPGDSPQDRNPASWPIAPGVSSGESNGIQPSLFRAYGGGGLVRQPPHGQCEAGVGAPRTYAVDVLRKYAPASGPELA
jgi:hypothetical protein